MLPTPNIGGELPCTAFESPLHVAKMIPCVYVSNTFMMISFSVTCAPMLPTLKVEGVLTWRYSHLLSSRKKELFVYIRGVSVPLHNDTTIRPGEILVFPSEEEEEEKV